MTKFWFFDLDGTLADTEGDIRGAWKLALADLGLSCPDFDEKFVAGPPIDEMTRILFPEIYTRELADQVRVGFARHYDNDGFPTTREYPGVLDEVRRLKAAGAKAYIVTNKRFAAAKLMAAHFGWGKVFDGVYAGDMHRDDAIGKLRKPELLALVMREVGASAESSVMVGDTISDFEAARANGVRSVGVTWGYGKPDELRLADERADSPLFFAAECDKISPNHFKTAEKGK